MERDPGRGHPSLATRSTSAPVDDTVAAAVRFWWISALRGSLALILGIGAMFSGASPRALVNFIAVYWLLGGLLTVRWASSARWSAGRRIGLIAGALAIGAGMILLARRALVGIVSADAVIDVVAGITIATGVLRLVGAFEIEERTGHRWTLGGFILGSIEVGIGVILFLVKRADAPTLRITIGIWGLAAGVLLLAQGWRMYRVRRHETDGATAPRSVADGSNGDR